MIVNEMSLLWNGKWSIGKDKSFCLKKFVYDVIGRKCQSWYFLILNL